MLKGQHKHHLLFAVSRLFFALQKVLSAVSVMSGTRNTGEIIADVLIGANFTVSMD
ncbi:hypothetical protein BH10BAC2_BH10BAC2_14460 [soil metagenome]